MNMWWVPAFIVAALTSSLNPNARVRPLDTLSRAVLRDGVARSPTLRGLVARLDQGDTIVHVESGYAVSQRDDAHLQFVSVSVVERPESRPNAISETSTHARPCL